MNDIDLGHLRTAIDVAQLAREHGNHPFGAILVDENNEVLLQAENTVVTENDCTGHAETNLIRLATQHFSLEKLASCTLYTSTEPCAMCAGAISHARIDHAFTEGNMAGRAARSAALSDAIEGRPSFGGPTMASLPRLVNAAAWR